MGEEKLILKFNFQYLLIPKFIVYSPSIFYSQPALTSGRGGGEEAELIVKLCREAESSLTKEQRWGAPCHHSTTMKEWKDNTETTGVSSKSL